MFRYYIGSKQTHLQYQSVKLYLTVNKYDHSSCAVMEYYEKTIVLSVRYKIRRENYCKYVYIV